MAIFSLCAIAIVACEKSSVSAVAPTVLLFNGSGTSLNDAEAVESILRDEHIAYATANSRQLSAMNQEQLRSYRLLIIPGGNFVDMGNGLAKNATANIRVAVDSGLNYLGICAGAFIAGNSPYNGLNLTSGVRFGFYSAELRNVRKAAVNITLADSTQQMHYWEDGPELSGWGDVIAKYPDGMPAIVEGSVGKGWVILSGTHPEAPERWRRGMHFTEPADVSRKYTAKLIESAINGSALPHY